MIITTFDNVTSGNDCDSTINMDQEKISVVLDYFRIINLIVKNQDALKITCIEDHKQYTVYLLEHKNTFHIVYDSRYGYDRELKEFGKWLFQTDLHAQNSGK